MLKNYIKIFILTLNFNAEYSLKFLKCNDFRLYKYKKILSEYKKTE